MPSIRTCLASLGLLALALAPMVAASVQVEGAEILARNVRANHVTRASPAVQHNKRSPKKAIKAAKKGPVVSSSNPYAPGSTFLSTAAALAAAKNRCGTDSVCARRTTPPTNASAYCVQGSCTFRCNAGYAPSGTACVAQPNTCGTDTCPPVDGGYVTCTGGSCTQNCFTDQGYSLYASGGNYKCFQTASDKANCGSPNHACPASYNNVGSPKCNKGVCGVACPVGTSPRKSSSTTNPDFCA